MTSYNTVDDDGEEYDSFDGDAMQMGMTNLADLI